MRSLVWITGVLHPLLLLVATLPASAETIPLEHRGGTYVLPVRINDAITLKFILDSGAAEVSIPADVVLTLERAGTIEAHDFIGTRTYVLADGSELPSPRFILRELQIGNHVVRNVTAILAPVKGDLLLGQSFLSKLPKWIIDNKQDALILGDEPISSGVRPQARRSAALPPPSKILPANAVEASDIRWMETCPTYYGDPSPKTCDSNYGYPSAYSFVLRNKTRQDILSVKYVVIFYDDQGTPIQSVEGTLQKTILAGLAKTLNSDLGGDAPYPGHEVRKNTRTIVVRILDYEASPPN